MKWTGILKFITDRNACRRGFNLTEIAIVLGVAGIILGGIWTVAVQGQENARQSALKSDLSIITKNFRDYEASQGNISGIFTTLTAKVMSYNPPLVPGDMLRANGVGGCGYTKCADHPWGAGTAGSTGSLGFCAWDTSGNVCTGSTAQYFSVELRAVPSASCVKAVMTNTGADAPPGLYDVVVNGTSFVNSAGVTHQLPPLPSQVQTACNTAASPTIDFVYRLVAPIN